VAWNLVFEYVFGPIDKAWVRRAVAALESLHRTDPVDVLISSYAPAATHLAAAGFCDRHEGVRWIADMRDEMSLNPHLARRERKILSGVERRVDRRADAVTAVSAPILDDFRRLLSRVGHFEEVRNGYDHAIPPERNYNEVFTIVYAGSFYAARKPHTFFEGLRAFLRMHPVDVLIRFVGTHRNFHVPADLARYCEFVPAVRAEEAVRLMALADANLLILPKVNQHGAYSGKLFDYLSVRKPVIAVVDPEDVAAGLIRDLRGGFVADFDEPDGIQRAIEGAYDLWKNRGITGTDEAQILALHRRVSVARLDALMDKLTAS
jgi:hypothetical protein